MNIVLFEPQIPGNTGNIARTCVGTNTTLHLVGRLGFSLSDKQLKRAGLDYWKNLDLKVHKDWNAFLTFCHSRSVSVIPEKAGIYEAVSSRNLPPCVPPYKGGKERGQGNGDEFFFFEKDAKKNLWEAEFVENSYLIFGSETSGFPQEIQTQYAEHFYKIPMTGPIRSLNLSSAVAVALYESLRQTSALASLFS